MARCLDISSFLCIEHEYVCKPFFKKLFSFYLENTQKDQLFTEKQNAGLILGDPGITAAVKSFWLVVQDNMFFNIMDHLAPLIRK